MRRKRINGKDPDRLGLKKRLLLFLALLLAQQLLLLGLYRTINGIGDWSILFTEIWQYLLLNFSGNCLVLVVYLAFYRKD